MFFTGMAVVQKWFVLAFDTEGLSYTSMLEHLSKTMSLRRYEGLKFLCDFSAIEHWFKKVNLV